MVTQLLLRPDLDDDDPRPGIVKFPVAAARRLNNAEVRYRDWINSLGWTAIRKERLIYDNYRCCDCGCKGKKRDPLHVHHRGYGRILGRETIWDLITLCRHCHAKRHPDIGREQRRGNGTMRIADWLEIALAA